jgi:hypothetical protein
MSRMSILVFGILIYLLLGMTPVSASSDSPAAPLVVIGSGTAASIRRRPSAPAMCA